MALRNSSAPMPMPVVEKGGDLRRDGRRLTGDEVVEVDRHGVNQPALVDQVRQGNQQKREQRNQRQQRVIRDGPGQQQTLVAPEVARDAADERHQGATRAWG